MIQVRPAKIRSKITVNNFKKFRPKILKSPKVPLVFLPKPRMPKRRAIARLVPTIKKLEPQQIQIKQPVRPPVPKIRTLSQQPAQEQKKSKTLLRQQLSDLRRQALKRGRVSKPKTQSIIGGQKVSRASKVGKTQDIRKIESLKNLGLDRILIMVAAGPSISEVDFDPIKNHLLIDFMCINKPLPSIWPSRYWAFCDNTQQRANLDTWNSYKGIIINSPNVKARKTNQIVIRTRPGKGFNPDVTQGYHIGRSSTYAALQVVHYMSYKKVFLFGVDMTDVDGKMHHYGQNPDCPNDRRKSRFPIEAQHYLWAGQHLPEESRKRFIFCSSYNPWPFLEYFKKLDHKEAVSEILKYVEEL